MSTSLDCTTSESFRKEIKYDRLTRDYALYLDGKIVGYARSYHEGERTLDELTHGILAHQQMRQDVA
jgi:hypothetical protein